MSGNAARPQPKGGRKEPESRRDGGSADSAGSRASSYGKKSDSESYFDSMHRLGRIGMLFAIIILLGIPTALGIYFDALAPLRQIIQAALPLLVIFVPSSLFEVISYTPILGSSIYLTLMTGEVINLKLPVANNAMRIMDTAPGTEEADVISSIAVSTSSFVTVGVVTIGVLLATPLRPILSLPAVSAASASIVPALFGALLVNSLSGDLGGGVRVRGRFAGLAPTIALLLLITLFDAPLSRLLRLDAFAHAEGKGVIMSSFQGFVVILMLPVSYFSTRWLYKKNRIRAFAPEDGSGGALGGDAPL
ncbi:MAG: hypothetical protein LBJ10_08105 [Clostridiales bacterium]|nr:hypothetical protein [Clostridiales bacterium]